MRGSAVMVFATLCGVVAFAAPGVAKADVGFQGPVHGDTSGSPSGNKPESKLWWNDGFWWASMHSPASGSYNIFRLNMRLQTWANTGVQIDTRDSTRQDALWTGGKLFVASHKFDEVTNHVPGALPDDEMRLYRFNYNPATNTYTPDGFPNFTVIDGQRSETLTIDVDSNGAIWATWVQQAPGPGPHQVYVTKTGDGCVTTPANCGFGAAHPLDTLVGADDISAIVRFGGNKVGVMWSDTSDTSVPAIGVLRFAVHVDGDPLGTWAEQTVISGDKAIDDHINLKADSLGRVYAVTKTKFLSAANPGTRLHRRDAAGGWSTFTVTHGGFDRTRPIVLLDQQHNRIRVFEAPEGGGAIFMKSSFLGIISFPTASAGTPVMQDVGSLLVNPSSTKQNITNTTRQIVIATNPTTRRYWHAYQQIVPCIRGTAGNNALWGTIANDVLCGLGGRDTIRSLAGHDSLNGGPGNDTLIGAGGRDRYIGGSGNDTIYARDTFRELVNGGLGFDRARVNRSDVRRSIERLF